MVLKHDQLDEDKPEILRISIMHNPKVLEFYQVIFILYNTIPLDVDDDWLCVMLKDLFFRELGFLDTQQLFQIQSR